MSNCKIETAKNYELNLISLQEACTALWNRYCATILKCSIEDSFDVGVVLEKTNPYIFCMNAIQDCIADLRELIDLYTINFEIGDFDEAPSINTSHHLYAICTYLWRHRIPFHSTMVDELYSTCTESARNQNSPSLLIEEIREILIAKNWNTHLLEEHH